MDRRGKVGSREGKLQEVAFGGTAQRVGLSYPRALPCVLVARAEGPSETTGSSAMRSAPQGPRGAQTRLPKHLPLGLEKLWQPTGRAAAGPRLVLTLSLKSTGNQREKNYVGTQCTKETLAYFPLPAPHPSSPEECWPKDQEVTQSSTLSSSPSLHAFRVFLKQALEEGRR